MVNETGSTGAGSGDPASRDAATDSRPISVSELLARTQAADAADAEVEAEGSATRGRGRRRAGRSGAVSVSELTGEIPRIDGPDSPGAPDSSGAPDASGAPETAAVPEAGVQSTAGPETAPWTPGSVAFPRSANPLARRGVDDRATRADAPVPRNTGGMPGFTPPPTRDFSAGAVAGRAGSEESAMTPNPPARDDVEASNVITGVIPVVGDAGGDTSVPDSAPASSRFTEVIDEDFEAYRSFSDVEPDEDEGRTKKRRWFSRGKKAAATPSNEPGASPERAADTVPPREAARTVGVPIGDEGSDDVASEPITGIIPVVEDAESDDDVHVIETDDVAGVDLESTSVDWSGPGPAAGEPGGKAVPGVGVPTMAMAADLGTAGPDPAADAAESDTTEPDGAGNAVATHGAENTGEVEKTGEVESGLDDSGLDDSGLDDSGLDESGSNTPTTRPAEPLQTGKSTKSGRSAKARKPAKARKSAKTEDAAPVKAPRSPLLAWLAVIIEVIVGLAVGIGLFWGFTELWRWNPYFALILAVIVIFGIVTFTHLVRRSNDLVTTLLALAAGLIVTMGPLVLLAT